jgi:Protein of unknown function (DUF1579)
MKKILFISAVLTIGPAIVHAQSAGDMEKWQAYMTPSDMHSMMAKWDGTWNEDITMWMAPGAQEQKMTATCENKMILGGRYQESKHEGNFMGMPFEGLSTTGWDNVRKVFVSNWVDNFGTGMMYMEGTWDASAKTMTVKGKMTDPMTGTMTDIRQVLKIVDDNTQVLEQYSMMNGKEFKSMEIKLTRKK